jgi:NAD(P)-dependent dehydrogenase (short-subunit alcohol dehydrogenase family)
VLHVHDLVDFVSEEAAAAALYLGSEDASYITGVTLLEDGGFSLF